MVRSSKLEGFLPNSAVFKGYSALSLFSLASLLNAKGGGGEGGRKGGGVRMLDSH